MKSNEIIYEEVDKKVIVNFKTEYIRQEGIWALHGKKKAEEKYSCLLVGKNKDIGSEIINDLGRLHFVSFRENGTIKYKNYNNVYCGFSYAPWQVQDYLYPYIAKEYCALKFVCIKRNKSMLEKRKLFSGEMDVHMELRIEISNIFKRL